MALADCKYLGEAAAIQLIANISPVGAIYNLFINDRHICWNEQTQRWEPAALFVRTYWLTISDDKKQAFSDSAQELIDAGDAVDADPIQAAFSWGNSSCFNTGIPCKYFLYGGITVVVIVALGIIF